MHSVINLIHCNHIMPRVLTSVTLKYLKSHLQKYTVDLVKRLKEIIENGTNGQTKGGKETGNRDG